jgi:ribosomal protein S18 acetylase RimI-like enzyme
LERPASFDLEMADGERTEIRRAGVGNAAEAARLLHAFNDEYEEPTPAAAALAERLRQLLTEDSFLVLLAGAPALGVAVVRLRPALWSGGSDAYLEELYVVPERRRRGLGRGLLEAAMEVARAAGADHFELTTAEADEAARSLYESFGMTNREGGPNGPRMLYYELDL